MSKVKTILGTSLLALSLLLAVGITPLVGSSFLGGQMVKANAAMMSHQRYAGHMERRHHKRFHKMVVIKKVIIVRTNDRFFREHGVYRRHPHFRRHLPRYVTARQVVIVDRENRGDYIVARNERTGAYSVNDVRVVVDHNFFDRFDSNINRTQNVAISVNTGNNTASFNTGSGVITTGNVNISVR